MSITLLAPDQAGVAAFASKDETRSNVTRVHLTNEYAEATNGHILMRVPKSEIDPADFPQKDGVALGNPLPPDGVLLDPEAIKRVQAARPKRSAIPILDYLAVGHVNGSQNEAILTATDLETVSAARVPQTGTRFPDADKVIPSTEGRIYINVNAHYLKALAEYAIKFGGKAHSEVCLWIDPKDSENQAIRIEVELAEGYGRVAVGALMPVKR